MYISNRMTRKKFFMLKNTIKFIILLLILNGSFNIMSYADENEINGFAHNLNWKATGLTNGASTWVNIWNYPQDNIEAYCQKYYANGITNLFVQTSRSNTKDIVNPQKLEVIIECCHKYGMKVIGWTYPNLDNIRSDAQKLITAAQFRTAKGEGLDGMVANLEHNLSTNNVIAYSQIIRDNLGGSYPLIACVYSPLNKCIEVKKTPWKVLSEYYDVIAPMAYWNSKYQKYDVYDYTIQTISQIRALSQKPYQNIHVIGDGMKTDPSTISLFLKACHDGLATSASVYPQNALTIAQCDALETYSNYISKDNVYKLACLKALYNEPLASYFKNNDIAQPVSTGDFLAIISNQINLKPIQTNLNKFLAKISINSLNLNQPINKNTAYQILAFILNSHQNHKHSNISDKNWLIPKAYADNQVNKGEKILNYLDLAQMLWQESNVLN